MNHDRGKVSRTSSGLYYKIKKYPELGGRSKKFSSMVSAAEVYRKMEAFEAELASGLVSAPSSPLFGTVAEEWLGVQENRIAPTTYAKAYRPAVDSLLSSDIAEVPCDRLSSSDFQRYIDGEASRSSISGSGQVSRSFIKNRLIVVRALCRYLVKLGYQSADLSVGITLPSLPAAEKVHALSQEDVSAIISSADNSRPVSVLFLVLLCQGLRVGEALGLRPEDVDLASGTMSISRTVYHLGNTAHVKNSPKTSSGRRVIPLIGPVLDMFRSHGLSYPIGDDPSFVFGFPSFSRYRDQCERYASDLGLPPDFHLHQLRHSCATILYDSGVDSLAAAAILGHSSYRVTAEVYTDIRRERLASSADDVTRYLCGGPLVEHVRLSDGFSVDWAQSGLASGDRLRVEYSADRILIVRE